MKKIFLFLSLFSIFLYISSCRSQQKPPKEGEIRTLYQCPMHPQIIQEQKGDCPICGMTLVERKMIYKNGKWEPYEEGMEHKGHEEHEGGKMEEKEIKTETSLGLAEVKISPEKQFLIGVKKDTVKIKNLEKVIKTYGKVDYKESKIYEINIKFGGWIEKLYANYEGMYVKKNDKLFEIYSPDIYQSVKELKLAYEKKDTLLFKNVKQKFNIMGIRDFQIEEILKDKEDRRTITFYSPYEGFIIKKEIFEGMEVRPGMTIYRIADLREVWVYGEIYEYEVNLIKKGDEAFITLSYLPEKIFKGKVSYIYPYLNPETRTTKVRIEIPNQDFSLKPNMYVNIEIKVNYGKKLVIPKSAVLYTGEKNIVFVDKGEGTFEPREVKLGISSEDFYEVIEGVRKGEVVVTSANFLIDSESSLKAALLQIGLSGKEIHKGH
ncbi:MAG: efflux RND transporter periplasmic adaptor subunit [candidate division WOR-3 bacterium]